MNGNWYTCETTHTSDGSETYLRTSVYRRTAVTGAGSLDLRNLIIDDITDGEPTQHGTATNTYDGHLRRVKQTSPRGTFYSIYNLAGQLTYQDNITTNERTDYISVGAEPVVRMIDGVRTAYVHTNHLGSTIAESDTNGDIIWREDYTPFGEARQNPSMNSNHTGFTGHAVDAASGLTYMQARYYDPTLGRFLSKDPVGFAEGGVGYFNRYSYVMNDPVNAVDPDGRIIQGIARVAARHAVRQSLKARLVSTTAAADKASLVADIAMSVGDPVAMAGIVGEKLADRYGGKALDAIGAAKDAAKRSGDTNLLEPGPYAKESTPLTPGRATADEQRRINSIGDEHGCHSCGADESGLQSGNWIGDHQPPQKLEPEREIFDGYPHCATCSRRQAGQVTAESNRRRTETD